MKAGPILALVLLVLIAGAAGYYYVYRFYGIQSTTSPSTSCPPGQVLINGACINDCMNGATNPPSCDSSVQRTDPDGRNNHVYHHARLTLVDSYITASAQVELV